MVWFYEKHGVYIRCETRDAADGAGYELLIIQPDGREHVERFDDSATLAQRQEELQSSLAGDGWTGPFGRTI